MRNKGEFRKMSTAATTPYVPGAIGIRFANPPQETQPSSVSQWSMSRKLRKLTDLLEKIRRSLSGAKSKTPEELESLSTAWYALHSINSAFVLPNEVRRCVIQLPSLYKWDTEAIEAAYLDCIGKVTEALQVAY